MEFRAGNLIFFCLIVEACQSIIPAMSTTPSYSSYGAHLSSKQAFIASHSLLSLISISTESKLLSVRTIS
ncbi:hypothetical protein Hanom_Chr11g00967701 [Helianthus anomalus]